MSQVAKSASAFVRAFLAILALELEDMVVRLFRPTRRRSWRSLDSSLGHLDRHQVSPLVAGLVRGGRADAADSLAIASSMAAFLAWR
jgi:hypothetical protein